MAHKVEYQDQNSDPSQVEDVQPGAPLEDVRADQQALDALNADPSREPAEDTSKPKQPKRFSDNDPRTALAKSARAARDGEKGPIGDADPVKKQEEADAAAKAAGDDGVLKQKVKLKVDGVETEVTVDDLVRNAQIHSAANLRLQEAERLRKAAEERLAAMEQQAPTNTDERASPDNMNGRHPTEDGNQQLPTHTAEADDAALADALEKIQVGSPEEGISALKKIIDSAKQAAPQQDAVNPEEIFTRFEQRMAVRDEYNRITAASAEFDDRFDTVKTDEFAKMAKHALLHKERLADFRAAGVPDQYIQQNGLNDPKMSAQAHFYLRMAGQPLRSLKEHLDSVAVNPDFIRIAGPGRSGNGRQVQVDVDRSGRKEGMQQQPALRSSASYLQPQQQDEQKTAQRASNAVAAMRKARGLSPM